MLVVIMCWWLRPRALSAPRAGVLVVMVLVVVMIVRGHG